MDDLYGQNKEKRFMFLLEHTLFDEFSKNCKKNKISIGKRLRILMLKDLKGEIK